MKNLAALIGSICLFVFSLKAQVPDFQAVSKSILKFSNENKTEVIKSYEVLQQRETAFFNRDTFTMIWRIEPGNLVIKETGNPKTPWKAHFDPTFASNVQHPVWHTYNLSACLFKTDHSLFLQDLDLVFFLDSMLVVKKVEAEMLVLQEGRSRKFTNRELNVIQWTDCMEIAYQGEEAKKPYLVGQRWRKTAALIKAVEGRKAEIEAALETEIRAKYTTAQVDEVLKCPGTVLECFDFPDPENGFFRSEGLFTAKSGPKELFYSARISFDENDKVQVEIERIWK